MHSLSLLRELYRHMEWADATTWLAIGELDTDNEDEQLFKTLHHLHATQHAFLDFWAGRPLVMSRPSHFDNLDAIRTWSRAFYSEAMEFMTVIEDDDLQQDAVVPWIKYFERQMGGTATPTSLGETLFQVYAHTQYHRGQVNRRLRELEGEPPLVDYIAWIWMNRPHPVWPNP